MAIAETARLMTELGLKDGLSPGLAKAKTALSEANAASSKASSGFLNLGKVTSGASSAFSTFTGRLGQLAGATGLIGLGAGLFSVVGLMEKSIHQAEDFGAEVYKLQAVTGLSAEKTSELAAAFHHFGIESDTALRIAGFAEKNIFAQGETTKKTAAFFKTYGFELRDASGHLKDFNTLLLDEADYFNNKAIPAATKDAELAKIFGRNWQALIPILKGGRAALQDAEEEATRLGLTLTGDNLSALAKLREATRSWGTALGGLELQIGLALVPTLTKFTTAATEFVAKNRPQIVGFFKSLADFAQNAADVVAHQVIPTIGGIYGAWMKIPADLRNFFIRGLIADRTIKFLFGVSPIKLVASLAENTIGTLFTRLAANKLVPQVVELAPTVTPIPVFVTNPGFGGVGGPGGLAPAAEAAGGGLAGIAAITSGVLGILGFYTAIQVFKNNAPQTPQQAPIAGTPANQAAFMTGLMPSFNGLRQDLKANTAAVQANTTTVKPVGAGLANVAHGYNQLAGKVPGSAITQSRTMTAAQFIAALNKSAFIGAAEYKSIFERFTTFKGGGRGTDPTGQGFLAIVEQLKNPKAPAVMFEIKGHLRELQSLEAYYVAHGDTVNAAKVQGVIAEVDRLIGVTRAYLPTVAVQQRIAAHNAIIQSSKMDRLNALNGATASNTGIVARKNFSPKIGVNAQVNIASTNSFNVNSLATSLVSTYTRVNVGNQYQGKALPGF